MGRICEKVGFKIREWKSEGVMDGENGESAEGGEVRGPAKDEPERERDKNCRPNRLSQIHEKLFPKTG